MSTLGNTATNCPTCAEPLGERGYFCKTCASQARCMKCRAVLETGAAACVECGTRIGQTVDGTNGTSAQPAPGAATIPANRNTLSYQEDRNNRTFEASLTDSAMHGLGEVLGDFFAQRGAGRTITQGVRHFTREVVVDPSKQLLPADEAPLEPPPRDPATSVPPAPDKVRLRQVFTIEGEVLELADNRMKATSAADYYRRLTYLFLYAQEVLLGRTSTPRTELNTALTAAKVYNGNCRTWLAQKKGFTLDTEDRLKLNIASRDEAKKVLQDVLNSEIADEWHPDTRTIRKRAAKKK
jgi:hypothetical protein